MLSTEEARHLLRDVQFPGDEDSTYPIAISGKLRKDLIRSASDNSDRRTAAAIEIQRIWRGFRRRQKYINILERGRKNDFSRYAPVLTGRYHKYVEWCRSELGVTHSGVVMDFRDYCARVIQVWWKTAMVGACGEQKSMKLRPLTPEAAVLKIQRVWKSYRSKKIFQFYQKLIDFRQRGDPAVLLKTVNPSEAKLLDKASGGCVRFRLGGGEFPPSIYYKIFTSQTVVDVCSCSPRDYTAMSSRRKLQRDVHNHGRRTVEDDGSNWYKRWENNGWRPVSERLFQSRLQDPLTVETSAEKRHFHHSKLQRKVDVEQRRRRKKIEWMKKLYLPQVEGAPASPTAEADTMETEVEELLEWTHGLNFEDYVSDWSQLATSAVPLQCDNHVTIVHSNK